jgi:hypothetical protein
MEQGIAIRSTVGRLRTSTKTSDHTIEVRRIYYRNSQTEGVPGGRLQDMPFVKEREFDYEKELRAALFIPKPGAIVENPSGPTGIPVAVDMNTLVEAVFLSPGAGTAFKQVIPPILAQANLSITPQPSALTGLPRYDWRPIEKP